MLGGQEKVLRGHLIGGRSWTVRVAWSLAEGLPLKTANEPLGHRVVVHLLMGMQMRYEEHKAMVDLVAEDLVQGREVSKLGLKSLVISPEVGY